ncbi:MAG: MgtC/SapB family protein [Halothiobacillaceae bacterium]|nr:MgtC/SapB family protein [Halothiobacillaceae bacterium]
MHNFDAGSLLDTFISLTVAFALGGLIGYERHLNRSSAGLRTNVLVAVGAAIFVDIANRYHGLHGGNYGTVHVIAYVVSGVGFLGAGVIMREGGNVRGLNTAATLWSSAAVGAAAGADLVFEAMMGTVFILLANTLLRYQAKSIQLRLEETQHAESVYIEITTSAKQYNKVLKFLQSALNGYECTPKKLEVNPIDDGNVRLIAQFSSRPADEDALDKIVELMNTHEWVVEARWQTGQAA